MGARIVIVVVALFLVPYTFLRTLVHEIAYAIVCAWHSALDEFDAVRSAWRARSINPEDWQ